MPARGFERGPQRATSRRREDGGDVELRIDPASERLQRLEPWPAWDGTDFLDLPVLSRRGARPRPTTSRPPGRGCATAATSTGSATTCCSGAVNAFTGEAGDERTATGSDRRDRARLPGARACAGSSSATRNYGEGSSREHAALSPRLLGGAAVIARSFARIHESNLKKQGLLALTFRDPADYDRIREDDRVSLVGLATAGAGPARRVPSSQHADGTQRDASRSRHSYSASQLEWFRAGSALNVLSRAER